MLLFPTIAVVAWLPEFLRPRFGTTCGTACGFDTPGAGACAVGWPDFGDGLLELGRGKNAGSLSANGIEGRRIETQGFEDGRGYLDGAHFGADRAGFEGGMGQQQDDIGVVMAEPAVLLLLPGAAGVNNAGVRGHDDFGLSRAFGWVR